MRRRSAIGMLCLSLIFCLSGGLVYAMPETSVDNHFETGIVDIELDEYQLDEEGKEEPYTDKQNILPGATISKIPRIHNEGNDCYVRAKVTFIDTTEVDESDLYGIGEDWVRGEDGYYYNKEILYTGHDTDLFQGVHIPEDMDQETTEGTMFQIRIDVDAIQSKNFTPDYEKESPWGDVEIIDCKKEGMYDVTTFKQGDNQGLSVEYQGDTNTLMSNPDDFFTNFPYLMPGDTYSDTAVFYNDSDRDIKLYFRNEVVDDSKILEKIELTIDSVVGDTSKQVYHGPLKAETITDNQLLGTLPSGQTGTFDFTIHVPAELNNDYSILSSYVRWIFSTEPIVESNHVQTGDNNWLGIALIVGGLCLGAAAICMLKKSEPTAETIHETTDGKPAKKEKKTWARKKEE